MYVRGTSTEIFRKIEIYIDKLLVFHELDSHSKELMLRYCIENKQTINSNKSILQKIQTNNEFFLECFIGL